MRAIKYGTLSTYVEVCNHKQKIVDWVCTQHRKLR